ncbi:MAG: NADH-quinone oxidoreductase subunit C [Candidatus Brocadiae bacterium]|nr:NADH-quinone oxidoreductase subunit C [Candidatus Brocadiia bacterium]
MKELVADLSVDWTRPHPNRVYISVEKQNVRELGRIIFEDFGARFATATGSDVGEELEVIYHFAYDAVGLVANMRVRTPKGDPVVPSVTPVVPAAEWIEREMNDLVGIVFEGHPDPRRLILADNWPEGVYPLRREHRDGA